MGGISPEQFAEQCRAIVAGAHGHAAHRALDLLTNDVLRQLGFGAGVAIFEAAVADWHQAADPYPYRGPCPTCEAGPLNIYRQRFSAPCCNNGQLVDYALEILTDAVVMVEEIQAAAAAAAALPQPYHETMADYLFGRFGGLQFLRAHHHGTDIVTRRGRA